MNIFRCSSTKIIYLQILLLYLMRFVSVDAVRIRQNSNIGLIKSCCLCALISCSSPPRHRGHLARVQRGHGGGEADGRRHGGGGEGEGGV